MIDSFRRREKESAKLTASLNFALSKQIGVYVAKIFDEKDAIQIPNLWDYFPELFKQEKEETEKSEQENQLAYYKIKMKDFSYRHNSQVKRQGGDK